MKNNRVTQDNHSFELVLGMAPSTSETNLNTRKKKRVKLILPGGGRGVGHPYKKDGDAEI